MEADEAIYAMNGYNYNGNKLVVELAGKIKNDRRNKVEDSRKREFDT
jgi:hypothetical protein